MSQNVALFRTPTRRMPHFTSKKPYDLGPFPAISAHFRSIPSHLPSLPVPEPLVILVCQIPFILVPRHGNPRPLAVGPPTTARTPTPSFSCPDTGIHAPSRSDRLLRREPRTPSFPCPDTGIHAPSRSDRPLRREPRTSVILVPRHGNPRPLTVGPPTTARTPNPRHSRAPTREIHAPSRSDRPLRRESRTPSFSCPDTGIHAPSVGPPTTARTPSPSFPCPDTGIHAPSVGPPTTARTPSPSFPCPDTGIHAPRPLVRRRCPARQPGVAVLRAPRYARTGPTVRTAEADQRRRLSSWTRSSSRFRGCGTT